MTGKREDKEMKERKRKPDDNGGEEVAREKIKGVQGHLATQHPPSMLALLKKKCMCVYSYIFNSVGVKSLRRFVSVGLLLL